MGIAPALVAGFSTLDLPGDPEGKSWNQAEIDCSVPEEGTNGKYGCESAVWCNNGEPAKAYCENTGSANGRFAWFKECCKYKEGLQPLIALKQPLLGGGPPKSSTGVLDLSDFDVENPNKAQCLPKEEKLNCNWPPKGNKGLFGCESAVWSGNGEPAKAYCENTGSSNGRFPWLKKCCEFDGGQCVRKALQPLIGLKPQLLG